MWAIVCLHTLIAPDPEDNVDVTVDDELSDEVLGSVGGGNPQKGPVF